MTPLIDNRAVTAIFRVWGSLGRPLQGDGVRRLSGRGAHIGEAHAIGVLIPIVVAVMMIERLATWFGPWWAAIAGLPAFIVALHFLGITIGMLARQLARLGGGRAVWGWRVWVVALTGWAGWALNNGGWARWVATGWILLVGFNLLSAVLLLWRHLMAVAGRPGSAIRISLAVFLHLALIPLVLVLGWWGLLWGGVLAASWLWGTFMTNSMVFGPIISRCDGAGVWLTIDDGPDPETTPRLLDLLDQHRARATFFLIGDRVDRHADLAREIVARGHGLGNHTGSHPQASFWAAGPGRTASEILAGNRSIESATGRTPSWFRAPVGHCNFFVHPASAEAGMSVVGWRRQGYDGVSTKVELILRRLTRRLQRGDILVVHDATPVAEEVLEGVLKRLDELGLACRLPGIGTEGQLPRRSTTR